MTTHIRSVCCAALFFLAYLQPRAQHFDAVRQAGPGERCALAEQIYEKEVCHMSIREAQKQVDELYAFASEKKDRCLELQALIFISDLADRREENKNEDSVLLSLRKALDFSIRHDFKKEEAELTYKFGLKQYNLKAFPQAFEYLLKSYEQFQEVGFDRFPNMNLYLYNLGKVYFEFADYNKALRYLNESLQYPFASARAEINVYNTLGLTYNKLENSDTSIHYYRKGLRVARQANDSVWTGILSGNMAGVFLKIGKADSAKPLILLDYTLSSRFREWNSVANCLLLLAGLNMDADSLGAADRQIREVEGLFAVTRSKFLMRDYFRGKARLAFLKGDFRQAYLLQDSFIIYKDRISADNDQSLLRTMEIKVQTEEYLSEIELLDSERRQAQVFRNFILAVAGFVVIIAYLVINRQRLKRKKDRAILLLEKQKAEEELKSAEIALQGYMNSLLEKNRLIDKFREETEDLKKKSAHTISPENEQIMDKLYQATILTEEDWTNFKRMFEKVHVDFFVRLKEKYPDLTLAEIRLIALTKLNLSINEIANMLGISPDSVRKTGSRMRKKLNLSSQTEISEIASDI